MKMTKLTALLLCAALLMPFFSACGEDDALSAGNSDMTPVTEAAEIPEELFGVKVISYEEYTELYLKNDLSDGGFIENMCFDSLPLPYAGDLQTYFVPVERDEDWSGGVLSCEGAELRFVYTEYDSFDVSPDEAVSEGYRYRLVAYNDSEYIMVGIVFTYMPVMTVDSLSEDADPDYPFGDEDSDAYMTLTSPGTSQSSETLIHCRGGSSRSFPKIGYKLNLRKNGENRKLNLLGMREDDDWILLPMYTEESKIRDKLSLDLWSEFAAGNNSFGIHNGAQLEYIELIINGVYWGLYGLVVPVDGAQQDIHEDEGEMLLKIESWEVPSSEELSEAGNAASVGSITFKKPDEPDQEDWNKVAEFVRLIYEAGDSDFEFNISNYVDVSNVLDYWIFVNLISGQDNAWKNMFVTYKLEDSGSLRILLCPWDCDLSWGVTWNGDMPLFWEYRDDLVRYIGGGQLPERIIALDVGNAVSLLQTKWDLLRRGILSEKNLLARIDDLTYTVKSSGAWGRDAKRWTNGGHAEDDNQYVKDFAVDRLAFLDSYIKALG